MSRTLKQKLKHQLKQTKAQMALHHEQAGITINYELQRVQAVAMGHGVMSALLGAKNTFDIESEEYKAFEKVMQGRIAQCVLKLIEMGISPEQANQDLMRGH